MGHTDFFDSNNNSVPFNQFCAGEYNYQIIDNLGCEYIDSFLIIEPQVLDLQINAQPNLLQAVATGGTLPYLFQWWNSGGLLSNSQDLYFTQSGVYYCFVYDYNKCNTYKLNSQLLQSSIITINYHQLYINYKSENHKII